MEIEQKFGKIVKSGVIVSSFLLLNTGHVIALLIAFLYYFSTHLTLYLSRIKNKLRKNQILVLNLSIWTSRGKKVEFLLVG